MNESNISPTWLSIKLKNYYRERRIKYSIGKYNIRVKKDSIIWISLKSPLGIEVLRSMILPDSVYLMNRIGKTYFIKPISHIKEVVKTDISFFQLQEILFSSPSYLQYEELKLSLNNEGKYILSSKMRNYTINKIFRIEKMRCLLNQDNITIKFNDYSFFDKPKYFYPNKIFINIEVTSEEVFSVNYDITKVEFNKAIIIKF